MEDPEEEEYEMEDNSNTIDDNGGVVFSSSSEGQEMFEVSIKKVSLDKPITSATFRFIWSGKQKEKEYKCDWCNIKCVVQIFPSFE